jgi:hypothetical protein
VLVGIVLIASAVQDGFCIACTNLCLPHSFFIGFWSAQSESMAMPRTHSECANARNIIWCVNCVAALVGIVLFGYAVQEGFCMLCTYFFTPSLLNFGAPRVSLWRCLGLILAAPKSKT